jgi:hypothetical protein
MRTSILVSLFLTLSAPMLAFVPSAHAQSATVTVNEAKRAEAIKSDDYKMYIEAMGCPNSDELFAQYKKERAAYTANPSSTSPTVVTTATNEEMKIASYKGNDYNLYVKANNGISNDDVHIQFNKERNAYLGIAGSVTPNPASVEPATQTTQAKPQKPSLTYKNRNSVKKPNYRTIVKPGVRKMTIKVIRIYQY